MEEDKKYFEVLNVTGLIRKKEIQVSIYLLVLSAVFTYINYFLYNSRSYYLVAVLFFGLAVSLLIKRDYEVKLGGLTTFALMLYYTLENAWLPLHFLIIWAVSIPIAIVLTRRGYIGPLLYFILAIVTLPLSAVTYVTFTQYLSFPLVDQVHQGQEVVYIFLPLIYAHTSLSLKRSLIAKDTLVFFSLIFVSALFWVAINSIFK